MSWSIEEYIGDCRPFPAQVIVYRGETDECMDYVSGEVADRLKAENDKLRELAENLLMAFTVLETPKEQQKCIDRALDLQRELGVLPMETFDARELGIEVD